MLLLFFAVDSHLTGQLVRCWFDVALLPLVCCWFAAGCSWFVVIVVVVCLLVVLLLVIAMVELPLTVYKQNKQKGIVVVFVTIP